MSEKILCPYCERSDEHPDGVEMIKGDYVHEKAFVCPQCDSESPTISPMIGESDEDAWERARTAAMRRFTPQPETTRLLREYSRPGVYANLWLHCEACKGKLNDNWKYNYCPDCGRKVVYQDE